VPGTFIAPFSVKIEQIRGGTTMFELTLVDHLRLMFGHVVERHQAHSRMALSRGRWSRVLKAAETLLLTMVFGTSLSAALGRGWGFAVAASGAAAAALVIYFLHITLHLESSARAHGECASRLWELQERYRAVLSDLSEGVIDVNAARHRRDALMIELHAIYRDVLRVDPEAYLPIGSEPPAAVRTYQPAA
jgi:hypothetical protein